MKHEDHLNTQEENRNTLRETGREEAVVIRMQQSLTSWAGVIGGLKYHGIPKKDLIIVLV